MPVTRPDASYDELLGKLGKAPVAASVATPVASRPGWLGRLFGVETPPAAEPPTENPKTKPVVEQASSDAPVKAVVDAPVKNLNVEVEMQIASELARSDEQAAEAIKSNEPEPPVVSVAEEAPPTPAPTMIAEQPPATETKVPLQSERELDDLIDTIIEEAAVSLVPQEPVAVAAEVSPASVEEVIPEVALKTQEAEPDPASVAEPAVEEPPVKPLVELVMPVASTPQQDEAALVPSTQGVLGDLFAAAQKDVFKLQDASGYEFGLDVFKPALSPEQISLLFDLSEEALKNPTSEKSYAEHLLTSDDRHVAPSTSLEQQVKRTEKILAAPVFTLKHAPELHSSSQAGAHQHEVSSAEDNLSPAKTEDASLFERIWGFAVDAIVMVFISAAAGLLYSAAFWQDGLRRSLESGSVDWLDLLPALGISLAVLPICLIVYPLVMGVMFDATLGQKSTYISLGQASGRALGLSNLLVRAFSMPLSMLFFGWLSLPFTRRALHDYLARTRVLRDLRVNP